MIKLKEVEKDALGEIVNIGFGRAASALSTLVNQRVILEAPDVSVYPIEELEEQVGELAGTSLVNVHQVFRGKLTGDAMLLMNTPSAVTLVDLLEGRSRAPRSLTAEDRETLVEMGNIILNAFIGSFGNLLKVHLTFTVPHFDLSTLGDTLRALSLDGQDVEYALVVRIRFCLKSGDVSGFLLIVMGIQSLQVLLEAMRTEGFIL